MSNWLRKATAAAVTIGMLASMSAPALAQEKSLSQNELRAKVHGLALGQGYWASRFMLGALGMQSGLGSTFMPDMQMMQKVSEMTGVKLDMMPKNVAMLQGVYASGDPRLNIQAGQQVDMMDYANFRWDQSRADKSFIPADQAWTILKAVEWAKDFHDHSFTPMDPMLGPALVMQSVMISMWAGGPQAALIEDMHDPHKMAYRIKKADGTLDPNVRPIDQVMMLWADSDITIAITDKTHYPKFVDLAKMMDPEAAQKMAMMADMDFMNVEMTPPTTLRDAAFGALALNYYAIARPEKKADAIKLFGKFAGLLNVNADNPVDVALALRGHAAAYQLLGDPVELANVKTAWANLEKFWDEAAGLYAVNPAGSKYVYNAFDLAALVDATTTVRALAAPLLHDPDLEHQASVRFVALFDNVWNKSGIYSADTAKTGRAAVNASQVTYDKASKSWSVTNDRFYTGEGMYLASALVWLIPGNASEFIMAAPKKEATVLLNHQPLTFDVGAQIVNDRTMVPLRGIFEALGAQVSWDQATRTVAATRAGKTISLTIGSTTATVDGKAVTLDAAPFISVKESRTLVPLRFISESLGAKVGWDGTSYAVSIEADAE